MIHSSHIRFRFIPEKKELWSRLLGFVRVNVLVPLILGLFLFLQETWLWSCYVYGVSWLLFFFFSSFFWFMAPSFFCIPPLLPSMASCSSLPPLHMVFYVLLATSSSLLHLCDLQDILVLFTESSSPLVSIKHEGRYRMLWLERILMLLALLLIVLFSFLHKLENQVNQLQFSAYAHRLEAPWPLSHVFP